MLLIPQCGVRDPTSAKNVAHLPAPTIATFKAISLLRELAFCSERGCQNMNSSANTGNWSVHLGSSSGERELKESCGAVDGELREHQQTNWYSNSPLKRL